MLDNRVETFLALCEIMNYTKTAETLHITQPAVTQQIRWLEEYYGCRLFSYQGKVLSLTEKGETLRRLAQQMTANAREFCKRWNGKRTRKSICGLVPQKPLEIICCRPLWWIFYRNIRSIACI